MGKILLVEDDRNLILGIEYALRNEGFDVSSAGSLGAAREAFNKEKYDLVLLDIMLPDGTGYDFCREIRKKSDIPIIFLTAFDEEVNVVMGLDIGGDDYITKPFRIRELISRIKAVLRRRHGNEEEAGNIISSGDLKVHAMESKVFKNGEGLMLTAMEYRLLLMFVRHPGQVLTRSTLLDGLWDPGGEFVDDNTLSVYIKRLREKIGDSADEPLFISTVRGIGYRWDAQVRRLNQ